MMMNLTAEMTLFYKGSTMKKNLIAFTCLLISVFTSPIFATTKVVAHNEDVSVLFIQNADKGTLTPLPGKPGFFTLKLTGIPKYIEFFTDRPHRTAGIYPTAKFVKEWQQGSHADSFNKVPPNAALSAIKPGLRKKKMVNVILQISEPTFNLKNDTATYIVHPLKGQISSVPSGELKSIALFIDSFCASCSGKGF